MKCTNWIHLTVVSLLLLGGPVVADPNLGPGFTTQVVYVQTEMDLADGCKLCYSKPGETSALGQSPMAKGKPKSFSYLEVYTDKKIELIVFPDNEKVRFIDVPTDSIPKKGDVLITLRSDFTVSVTSYKPKNK